MLRVRETASRRAEKEEDPMADEEEEGEEGEAAGVEEWEGRPDSSNLIKWMLLPLVISSPLSV